MADQVADHIRSAIHQGEFTPGQRLVERKLGEELGVSHIPIREALRALAEEGLVEKLPRRGARVVAMTGKDLDEISSLRTVLEQLVVVRAQQGWNRHRDVALRSIVTSMVEAAEGGDTGRLFELDQKFHEQLWVYADHKLLLSVASQLRSRIGGFLAAANRALAPEGRLTHAQIHAVLVDAIASGDPDIASQAMAEHIQSAKERIEATVELSENAAS